MRRPPRAPLLSPVCRGTAADGVQPSSKPVEAESIAQLRWTIVLRKGPKRHVSCRTQTSALWPMADVVARG
eukprot:104293-Prymnesium_polylepis.2